MAYKFVNNYLLTKKEMLELTVLAGELSLVEYATKVIRAHIASQQADTVEDSNENNSIVRPTPNVH